MPKDQLRLRKSYLIQGNQLDVTKDFFVAFEQNDEGIEDGVDVGAEHGW